MTKDPETRYTQSGKAVTQFTIAVNRPYSKNADRQEADFINCVAWEKKGEIIGSNFAKGSRILVEGRMQNRSYDAQDGSKRYVTEIIVQDFDFIDKKQPTQSSGTENSFGNEVVDDETIPF